MAGEKVMQPNPNGLHVLLAEQRLLIVRLAMPICNCLLVSAHGLHWKAGRCVGEVAEAWAHVTTAVNQLKQPGDRVIMGTDGNAHLHAMGLQDMEHAAHFRRALMDMEMAPNIGEEPVATYQITEERGVQDDYICTSSSVHMCRASTKIVDMAHLVEKGNHEMLAADFLIQPRPAAVPISRRKLKYDKNKLNDPRVGEVLRARLAKLPLLGFPSSRLRERSLWRRPRATYFVKLHRTIAEPRSSTG